MISAAALLGKSNLGVRKNLDDYALYEAALKGISPVAVGQFSRKTGLAEDIVSSLIPINPKTYSRRKTQGVLAPKESDRLISIAKVYAHAIDIFGTTEKTLVWLNTPNLALKHEKPLQLLKTSLGCHLVDQVLYRIDHGIYS